MAFGSVIDGHARRGEVKEAEAGVQRMTDHGLKPDAICYNMIIKACMVAGDATAAERWLERLMRDGHTPGHLPLGALLKACGEAGDAARATKWLEWARVNRAKVTTFSFN